MNFYKSLILLPFLFVLISCSETHFREDKFFAGGVHASADQLNLGKSVYTEYCMACHGVDGDGNGVAAKGMYPPPRNFKTGIFKFGKVLSGELPHDKHMVELIQKGLNGTAMLPWDISDEQSLAVFQYIKTFAPKVWEGKDKEIGEEVKISKDPFGLARRSSAIALGKEVYHGTAQCFTCHRAYVTKTELSAINLKVNGEELTEDDFDEEMYLLKIQETEHGYRNLPPDFTWHEIRSANTVEEIAIRLAAGIGGTSMPAWKDTITDEEIWAVSYYVKDLMELKNKPSRKVLMTKINNQ